MLIELLVVGVILSYLYSIGFLSFDDPWAIFISAGIVLTAGTFGFLVTHFIARKVVDNLFGLNSWSTGRSDRKLTRQQLERRQALQDSDFQALKRLVSEIPADAELSRRLADQYWQRGQVDAFRAEKLRILEFGKLTSEETCTIYNRLADLELEAGRADSAISHLKSINEKYPLSSEAANARKRIENIEKQYPTTMGIESIS